MFFQITSQNVILNELKYTSQNAIKIFLPASNQLLTIVWPETIF